MTLKLFNTIFTLQQRFITLPYGPPFFIRQYWGWAQGLTLTRQVLYCLSTFLLFVIFWIRLFLAWVVLDHDPIYTSNIAPICYQAQLICWDGVWLGFFLSWPWTDEPPDLCLPNICDYRHKSPHPVENTMLARSSTLQFLQLQFRNEPGLRRKRSQARAT